MPERRVHSGAWDEHEDESAFRPLTRDEARSLRERQPQVPAWWVVAAQAAVGGVVTMLAWLVADDRAVWASALYGAAVVVVPGALMARGIEDVLARRSRLLFLDAARAAELIEPVAALIEDELQRRVGTDEREAFAWLARHYRSLP